MIDICKDCRKPKQEHCRTIPYTVTLKGKATNMVYVDCLNSPFYKLTERQLKSLITEFPSDGPRAETDKTK